MGWNQHKMKNMFWFDLVLTNFVDPLEHYIVWAPDITWKFGCQLDAKLETCCCRKHVQNLGCTSGWRFDTILNPSGTLWICYGSLPTYRSFTTSSLLNIVIFHSYVKYVKLPEGNRPCNSPLVCLVRTLLCYRHVNMSKSFRVRLLKKTSAFSKTLNLQQSG